MRQIICVDNKYTELSLNLHKIYILIKQDDNYFYVVDETNKLWGYNKVRFKDLYREEKLKRILKCLRRKGNKK